MNKEVLIVDDSNTNNFLLQSILESEGIHVSIAFSGKEAFDYLKANKPSLILLDIMMPYIDGFGVLEKLRSKPETKDIPVVFITARNEENLKDQALKAGATGLITKPVDVNKVLEIVKGILTSTAI